MKYEIEIKKYFKELYKLENETKNKRLQKNIDKKTQIRVDFKIFYHNIIINIKFLAFNY